MPKGTLTPSPKNAGLLSVAAGQQRYDGANRCGVVMGGGWWAPSLFKEDDYVHVVVCRRISLLGRFFVLRNSMRVDDGRKCSAPLAIKTKARAVLGTREKSLLE